MHNRVDIIGFRFGLLTVKDVRYGGKRNARTVATCICDCGRWTEVYQGHLASGGTKSCGCLKRLAFRNVKRPPATGRRKTVRPKKSPEYSAWTGMKSRCYNPKVKNFRFYGAKGVTVHEEWRVDFSAFFAAVGPRPGPDYSLDRFPNNQGNYEPGNVRWANNEQQHINRKCSRFVVLDGERMWIKDAAKKLGITYGALWGRVRRGLIQDASV